MTAKSSRRLVLHSRTRRPHIARLISLGCIISIMLSAASLAFAQQQRQRPRPTRTTREQRTNPPGEETTTENPQPSTRPVGEEPLPASEPYQLIAKQMKWRSIGPANMGGRVADITVDPKKPYSIIVALGTGGLIKSNDNGTSWSGIFERQSVASTGAVAIAPTDSKMIWVGTGEPNGRNSSSWGDGVYKSTDGGQTWTNMGLKESQIISRVIISPTDANTVYVAALGRLWGANKERGIYKTTDGGQTWSPLLQVDENTGAIDLVMDPSDPNTLYAAMYYRRRTPYSFTSGGPTGGIYKTSDAGRTWKKLTTGLPASTGRIGLDVYRKNPNVVYAVMESDVGGGVPISENKSHAGGVFRSDDKGETWQRVNELAPRSFYFSVIRVDPNDDKRIYVLGFGLHVSDDGGKTFRANGARNVHPDLHALWIDPANPDHLLLGTDGGVYASYNRSDSWQYINNFPVGEFYRVAVDMQRPYNIAGGLQDNFSWIGPSQTRNRDGITNSNWQSLGGGDGMYCAIDPNDPSIVYTESQNGTISRLNLKTGERKSIQPAAKEGQPAFRFNWTSPFWISHFDNTVLYLGGNRLFKLTERGDKWEAISPDLSTQDVQRITTAGSGAETNGAIYTISESMLTRGLIWTGTDDGKVWLTRNDGRDWADLTANLPREAKGLWVSRVEASHFDEGTAFVAIDGHRNDVYTPLLFITTDYGKSWKSIAANIPRNNPVKVIREDPVNKNLLFAGTEFGFYVSFDRGGRWTRFMPGLPTVAVDDILVHPRERDLIIATHGRSLYIMDDIRPLEELTPEVLNSDLHLFSIRTGLEFYYLPGSDEYSGKGVFKAPNPPFGTYISFYLKRYTGEDYSINIADASGRTIRKLSGTPVPEINRVVWNLQPDAEEGGGGGGGGGGQPRLVRPGEYTVTLTVGEKKATQKVRVEAVEGLTIKD
ncbi:MAG TPA: hypothetical protein VGB17_19565 [Pyrinomonadaceae bacterium]|jgi:photosystem II stability/assembly factor-like uncharacterized protein